MAGISGAAWAAGGSSGAQRGGLPPGFPTVPDNISVARPASSRASDAGTERPSAVFQIDARQIFPFRNQSSDNVMRGLEQAINFGVLDGFGDVQVLSDLAEAN